ncbi:hypothetical protein J0X14_05595 [Muricauda sp. CAU 1633]|uniref:Ig-like domain-containing protein n=1 Tax=Allomuricauda sp. CAU 1633 TaxID=2816036 RepID=UPI001A9061A7|nr:Ig-like domain-containing protein [Muricauda sp. CAU 1633]MBO0321761.1 hypothetical protein [Muricauda sp. CAU 1633]
MRYLPTILVILSLSILFTSCSKGDSSEEPEVIDTTPPTIDLEIGGFGKNFTGPMVVANTITVRANANDNDKLKSATVYINGDIVTQSSTAPFTFTLDLSGYASKDPNPQNFKGYTLKLEVSDISNNVSSVEQILYIDNDLPSISDVSLQNGIVLNGRTTTVTFTVSDAQEIKEVTATVDNAPLEVVEETAGYSLLLNTTLWEDGEKLLEIRAEDYAGNSATYQVDFISDNSGPEVMVEGITANQILGEQLQITPTVSDEYSEVSALKVYLDDELLGEFETFADLNIDFDPESYPVGQHDFVFEASDTLGNTSSTTIPVTIKRLLITININEGYLPPEYTITKLFYLASDSEGQTLDFTEGVDNSVVKLYASTEFPIHQEFTLTLLEISGYLNGTQSNDIFSIGNLTRGTAGVYNLQPRKINSSNSVTTDFKITGLDPCAQNTLGWGPGYSVSHGSGSEDLSIQTFYPLGDPSLASEKIYLFLDFRCLNQYKYIVYDNPIPDGIDTNIDVSDFIDTDIQQSSSSFSNSGFVNMEIFGYSSLDDYRMDLNYELDESFKNTSNNPGPLEYFWLDIFAEYKHRIVSYDFTSVGRGLPQAYYEVPDWSIDHSLSNNIINYSIGAGNHSVGKTVITKWATPTTGSIDWIYIFDSQNTNQIVIPELPDELADYQLYDFLQEENYFLLQTQLTKYDGINSYNDYIQQIVKPNKSYQSQGDLETAKYKLGEDRTRAFIIGDFFMYR